MSTQRREVAALAAQIDHEINDLYSPGDDVMGEDLAELLYASGYRKHRTITTTQELDTLPVGTVVIDGQGDVCERLASGWCGIVKEGFGDPWMFTSAEEVTIPATVLHEPTA